MVSASRAFDLCACVRAYVRYLLFIYNILVLNVHSSFHIIFLLCIYFFHILYTYYMNSSFRLGTRRPWSPLPSCRCISSKMRAKLEHPPCCLLKEVEKKANKHQYIINIICDCELMTGKYSIIL